MLSFARILVPIDFSSTSDRAVAAAIDIARMYDARVVLLHVWSVPSVAYAEAISWPVEGMEGAAQGALDEAVAKATKAYAKTEGLLRFGVDWERIVETTTAERFDLVVMGTHGRRGLPRLLLGSVAEKVVRLSPVPVLTVRDPESVAKTG